MFKKRAHRDDEENEATPQQSLKRQMESRRRIEEIIGEKGGGYWELIENSGNLIQSVTPEGNYFYTNRKWLETLGYTLDEVEGLNFMDVIHPESREHCMFIFGQLMDGKKYASVRCDFISSNGARIPVEGNVSCYFEQGKPIATRGIFRVTSGDTAVETTGGGDEEEGGEAAAAASDELEGVTLEDVFLAFQDLIEK